MHLTDSCYQDIHHIKHGFNWMDGRFAVFLNQSMSPTPPIPGTLTRSLVNSKTAWKLNGTCSIYEKYFVLVLNATDFLPSTSIQYYNQYYKELTANSYCSQSAKSQTCMSKYTYCNFDLSSRFGP